MARIICVTSGLTGILNASFEMMSRLKNEGHELICAAPLEVEDKVTREGFKFELLPPLVYYPKIKTEEKHASKWAKLFHRYRNIKSNKAQLLDQIYPKEYVELLRKYQPDLILLDVELHDYIIVTYSEKTPFVLLSQWFSIWRRPDLPYSRLATIPGEGWRGTSLGIWWSWLRVKGKRSWQFGKKKIKSGFTDRRSLLLALAKRYGFPRKYIGDNFWPGPFLYNELPVMAMVSEHLEFPHKKRKNLFYVGAMVNDKRKDLPARTVNSYTLADVFKYLEKNNSKLIYCSVSTMKQGDSSFLDKVIEAVRSEENWVLVISTGKLLKESSFNNRPKNVFTFSFVPQLELLANADCSINHGGIHTINECIHYGVPMLVYSGKKADQNGCAARVAYHKVGLIGDKDLDDSTLINKKIGIVLGEEVYRENIKSLQKVYLQNKASNTLQSTIQSFLNK